MSKLIGTAPNQVPSNADLGTMAYQDYDVVAPQLLGGRRNLIINGAMKIAQRNTSVSSTTSTGYQTVDRFYTHNGLPGSGSVNYTYSHEEDAPFGYGFSHSQKVTVDTSGYTPADSYDYVNPFVYAMEGKDADALGWGYSGAKPAVLSFWYKSSLIGVHSIQIRIEPSSDYNSSGYDSLFHAGFEVKQANTWEYHVIPVPAITTNQQWARNSNAGVLKIIWTPISKQDYAWSYNGGNYENRWIEVNNWGSIAPDHDINNGWGESNTFQLTGVQFEIDYTGLGKATPFEHRSYSEELANCMRYFQISAGGIQGHPYTASIFYATHILKTHMRVFPSVSLTGPLKIDKPGVYNRTQSSSNISISDQSNSHYTADGVILAASNFSSLTTWEFHNTRDDGGWIYFDAEL